MSIPEHIFITGVPGSHLSSIAQIIETVPIFNTSNNGTYFGRGMEYEPVHIYGYKHFDQAWIEPGGHKLIKSHDWAYNLNAVRVYHKDSWTILVYRPDMASYAHWHEQGGFNIEHPCYSFYKNSNKMLREIQTQNERILKYACEHNACWEYFTQDWVERELGYNIPWPTQQIKDPYGKQQTVPLSYQDVLVTLVK